MNWPEEIKLLMRDRDWSLRQLAVRVNMSATYLSDVIAGKSASPTLKLRILDMRGYDLASSAVLKLLLPKEVAEELVVKEKQRAHASVQEITSKEAPLLANGDCKA